MLRGVRKRFGERQQQHRAESERQDSCEKGKSERAKPPSLPRESQLEQEIDSGGGHAMQQRLRVARGQDQQKGDDRNANRAAVGLRHEPSQAEEEQRKGRGRGGEGIAGEEYQVIAEGPAD